MSRCMVYRMWSLTRGHHYYYYYYHHHHHHHLPPWIMSFDLFRHRRIVIVSWGVHDLFVLGICSWGRVSAVWCCPFFQGGWSSFVSIWFLHLLLQGSLVCHLIRRYPRLCVSAYEYFIFLGRVTSPFANPPFLEDQFVFLSLASLLRPVLLGRPYQEHKVPAGIACKVIEAHNPPSPLHDKVVTIGDILIKITEF